ncbi:hypothetical protein L9F63_006454, partial [Diploptera punctata]
RNLLDARLPLKSTIASVHVFETRKKIYGNSEKFKAVQDTTINILPEKLRMVYLC